MKKYSYGKIIGQSWGWMLTVLFRPFNLKKWIILGIIVMFAGQLGGFNFSFNLGKGRDGFKKRVEISREQILSPEKINRIEIKEKISSTVSTIIGTLRKNTAFLILVSLAGVSVLIVMLLWLCVMSIFVFIFIESAVKNDASVRIPFHKNKNLGISYFSWNLIFRLLAITIMGTSIVLVLYSLFKSGVFSNLDNINARVVLSAIGPYAIFLVPVSLLLALIGTFAIDFVPVIMYSRKIHVMKAWGIFLSFLKRNPGEILLYLLVKLGLGILSIFAALLLLIIGFLIIALIGGAVGLMGFLIYILTPAAAKPIVSIVLMVIGIPAFVVIFFVMRFIFLPLAVFFRLFSIYFLQSIDDSLDPFMKCAEELEKGEDLEKYKKPLSLLWTAMLSPIIPILLMLAAFLAGGQSLIKASFPETKMPAIPGEAQIEKVLPTQKVLQKIKKPSARVFLKNGQYFEAAIIEEVDDFIIFGTEGGTFTVHKDEIKTIERTGK